MEDSFLKIWNVLGTLDQMVLRVIHFDVHDMHMQGATEMVCTCPRQVVLISGQVGRQPYLSFG